ncbi:MAG: glycosyltransferase [Crocinitomicaceae bacterium]|nr:glycosyltransferase [Crocinitomicaceae bacterium]
MKKIIIISYFFPPSNFVGGERTKAWSEHLFENGIYPIIITRNWNENQNDLVDKLTTNEYSVESTDSCEIRRMPYRRSLRDRLSKYRWLKPLQKLLTLKEVILSNYSLRSLPYSNFYNEAKSILAKDKEVIGVICSGRPFQSFFIGHQLKKEFNTLWIPDYRDEWTTHKHHESNGLLWKWINKLERKSELKWTSNADAFMSVSEPWKNTIEKLIGRKGHVILNGYASLHEPKIKQSSDHLLITYAGTLYPSQNIDILLKSVEEINLEKLRIKLRFIGVSILPSELDRLKSNTSSYGKYVEFMDRVPKNEIQGLLEESDLLYLTSFEDIKGWYPVKLFEYYASGIPILLCPSDQNVMQEFIEKSNSGYVANSITECKQLLLEIIDKTKSGDLQLTRNIEYGNLFSRKYQSKELANLLTTLSDLSMKS